MPRFSSVVALDKILSKLMKQRQEHVDALAKIDGLFAKFGINPAKAQSAAPKSVAEAPAKPAAKRRRKRGHFAQTAEQFILEVLKNKSLTGSEINAAWEQAGRKNRADNMLSVMTKKKLIKRVPLKEGRGSNYSVA